MIIQNIFQSILSFIHTNGYIIIFIGMIIEGPIVITVSAFAASLGYFNIFIVFLLAIIGDLIGDFLHFMIGKFLGKKIIERHGKKAGLNKKIINFLERSFKKHLIKIMMFLKLVPPFTSIGLLLIGSSKIKIRKFIITSLLTTLPMVIFYTTLGYFLGALSNKILRYIRLGEYTLFFGLISIIIVYIIVKKIAKKVQKSKLIILK